MPVKIIDNTQGGLSLRDSELLKDNQFSELKNWYYDKDGRLRTRKGILQYFNNISDTVVVINECDATTGWSVSDDGANLATGTAIRGSNSLSFDITVAGSANNDAILSHSSLSKDISSTKDYITFWMYVPSGFNTNLTDVKVRLGTDSSNYYEWTLGTLTEGENNFVKLNFNDATETGTVNDASIALFKLTISYNASYTDKSGILIDKIVAYSATYNEPVQGYFFVEDYVNSKKITIVVAGENAYLLTDDEWELIDTGLTKYETATGKTDQRTRWDFFAYNGSGTLEVGMCNGIDNYRKWDGTTITEFASQPKYRYFLVLNDRVFSSTGDITLYYTNAAIANINALDGNDVDVGTEMEGNINGLFGLGEVVLVGKQEKVFYVDVDTPAALPIDSQDGLFSHRATANVGNAVLCLNKAGINNLRQRDGVTGGQALVSKGYSDDLQDRFKLITDNQRNANCGFYHKFLNNYYFSFDTGDDNKPDTTFVYSSLVKAWSEYTYPATYQYGYYIDSTNTFIPLMCSANAGQIYQIETGYDDLGSEIEYSFKTKTYNMKAPATWKDWKSVDLIGLKNKGSVITLNILIDGDVAYTADLDDNYIDDEAVDVVSIGEGAIGEDAIGGGASSNSTSEIDLYRYRIRLAGEIFAAGRTIQIQGTGSDTPTVLTLDRLEMVFENNTIDILPLTNYA